MQDKFNMQINEGCLLKDPWNSQFWKKHSPHPYDELSSSA